MGYDKVNISFYLWNLVWKITFFVCILINMENIV